MQAFLNAFQLFLLILHTQIGQVQIPLPKNGRNACPRILIQVVLSFQQADN
jgi:hypothetical protein